MAGKMLDENIVSIPKIQLVIFLLQFQSALLYTVDNNYNCYLRRYTVGRFYWRGLTSITARSSHHMYSYVWDETTYPFPYVNGCKFENGEVISYHILETI